MKIQQTTMQDQTSLMQRQLDIMQKQDQLMTAQLARRADLSLKVRIQILKAEDGSTRGYKFTFDAFNAGNKSAENYYWHLMVPLDFSPLQRMDTAAGTILLPSHIVQQDIAYSYYKGFDTEPVYPTRSKQIGEISINTIPTGKPLKVRWQFISEDGAFPEGDHFAEVEATLV